MSDYQPTAVDYATVQREVERQNQPREQFAELLDAAMDKGRTTSLVDAVRQVSDDEWSRLYQADYDDDAADHADDDYPITYTYGDDQ